MARSHLNSATRPSGSGVAGKGRRARAAGVVVALAAGTAFLAAASPAGAVTLSPGDILVIDSSTDRLVRVDPGSGAQTVVSADGSFVGPRGVALEADGDILIADFDAFDLTGGVIRVDPVSGAQTTVSSGGSFHSPTGVAVEADGDILVADRGTFGSMGAVIRVDPVSGAQTIVSSGGLFAEGPTAIAVEADGDILVTDPVGGAFTEAEVIRIDPVSGAQTIVSEVGSLRNPNGLAVEADGDILVSDQSAFLVAGSAIRRGGVIRIDPVSGAQTTVSAAGSFRDTVGVALEADGDILATDFSLVTDDLTFPAGVVRVDPVSGAQTTVTSEGLFALPAGIAVVPTPQFAFTGFAAPIDNDTANTAKSGRTIPVGWHLELADGTPVSDPGSFTSLSSQAGSGACAGLPSDAIETYAGGSGLQYLGNGDWQFNWQTPKSYAGQCRTLILTLDDGSTHTAAFEFR